MTGDIKEWENYMREGQQNQEYAKLEDALRSYNHALFICETAKDFPDVASYRRRVLRGLGSTIRRLGRYSQATDILNEGLSGLEPCVDYIEMSLELSEVYRYLNRLHDAKSALEESYKMAKQLHHEDGMCRAIGLLGKLNYELSQREGNRQLLEVAIDQLLERIELARGIKNTIDVTDPVAKDRWLKINGWESIAMSRLSRCYSLRGDTKKAIATASDALKQILDSPEVVLVAVAHLFLGLALQIDGQSEEALKYFNPSKGRTPAIALSQEPSEEHREYLKELVAAGADMDRHDEHGYSALDYAVFSGDAATEELVLEGMRRNAERKIIDRHKEAKLRKGYRELFQEKIRPLLLRSGDDDVLQTLRHMYAGELNVDEEKKLNYDGLKFVPYFDFRNFGRLPGYNDNLTREWSPTVTGMQGNDNKGSNMTDFLVFFSYRWMNREGLGAGQSSDDGSNSQYSRMLNAVEDLLRIHPSVEKESLGIWVDYACIDQRNPSPGVSALPMIVAQCNAVVSLVDEKYYDRAWCSVECLLIQTLKKSYNKHLWYEYVKSPDDSMGRHVGILREGPMDLEINVAEKHLTFEEDRLKVLFLERQSKLLG